jgi:hypothetical protein
LASRAGHSPDEPSLLVLFLIPTRGNPRLVVLAIRCFQLQTWPERELVIVTAGMCGRWNVRAIATRVADF